MSESFTAGNDAALAAQWEEMKSYVCFDEETERALRRICPAVMAEIDQIVEKFYLRVLDFEGARSVLTGPEQVERLKQTLRVFVEQMLTGPYDTAYYMHRRRIGHVHVRVGLPEYYVFTALNGIRSSICKVAAKEVEPSELLDTIIAIGRITDLELAVMSSTYLEAHEERQLRSLQDLIVQNLPVTVLCLDSSGRVTSATRPSTRLFGGQSAQGQHYEDYLPSRLVEDSDLPSHLGRALATGHEISIPRVLLEEEGSTRHFRITLVPLDHELARVLLHIEELTDVVIAEQRVQQAESLARIGSLAAHLAHEIRNPLAAISATLQVIVGSLPQNDRRKAILDKVRGQVHRLDRLVTDLLGYARPARAELSSVELRSSLLEAVQQSGVDVEVTVPATLMVAVDRQYLQQVVVNLVQNARDALEGASLHPSGRVRIEYAGDCSFDVVDEGPGISSEVAESLFEPFVTSKVKGTGLGLAVSRKMVRAMGGDLSQITESKCTRFRVALRRPDS